MPKGTKTSCRGNSPIQQGGGGEIAPPCDHEPILILVSCSTDTHIYTHTTGKLLNAFSMLQYDIIKQ